MDEMDPHVTSSPGSLLPPEINAQKVGATFPVGGGSLGTRLDRMNTVHHHEQNVSTLKVISYSTDHYLYNTNFVH